LLLGQLIFFILEPFTLGLGTHFVSVLLMLLLTFLCIIVCRVRCSYVPRKCLRVMTGFTLEQTVSPGSSLGCICPQLSAHQLGFS